MSFKSLGGHPAALQHLNVVCCPFQSCPSTERSADSWLLGSGTEGCLRPPSSAAPCESTAALRWHHLRSSWRGWWGTMSWRAPTRSPSRPRHDKQSWVGIYLVRQRQEKGKGEHKTVSKLFLIHIIKITNPFLWWGNIRSTSLYLWVSEVCKLSAGMSFLQMQPEGRSFQLCCLYCQHQKWWRQMTDFLW